ILSHQFSLKEREAKRAFYLKGGLEGKGTESSRWRRSGRLRKAGHTTGASLLTEWGRHPERNEQRVEIVVVQPRVATLQEGRLYNGGRKYLRGDAQLREEERVVESDFAEVVVAAGGAAVSCAHV